MSLSWGRNPMIVEKTKVSKSSNVRTAALLTSVPLKTSPQTPCRENSSKNYYLLSTLLPTKKKRKAQIIAASEYLHALPIITIPSMPCFLQSYSVALHQACVVVVHIVVKTLSFPSFFLKKKFLLNQQQQSLCLLLTASDVTFHHILSRFREEKRGNLLLRTAAVVYLLLTAYVSLKHSPVCAMKKIMGGEKRHHCSVLPATL